MLPALVSTPPATSPSILMIAGEASADHHGAAVMRELKRIHPTAHIFGIGGAAMRAQGLEALVPAEEMALAGLTEVLWALPRMFRVMKQLTQAAQQRQPCMAILMDLPDFNMRLAKRLRAMHIPVIYYISPQVWAWRQKRVEQIRRDVSKMLVILPFEKAFYEAHHVPVEFVGHPLLDALPDLSHDAGGMLARVEARAALGLPQSAGVPDTVVALLPGSRHKEVTRHLPVMLEGIRLLRQRIPHIQAVIPVASTIERHVIEDMVRTSGVQAHILNEQATTALLAADAAVVCSGTATLQAALLLRPMVVVYKVSWLTYQILKRLVRVAHIGLVNLIAGQRVVPELVQHDMTAANIAAALAPMLQDQATRAAITQQLTQIRQRLQRGGAATRVAEIASTYVMPSPVTTAHALPHGDGRNTLNAQHPTTESHL